MKGAARIRPALLIVLLSGLILAASDLLVTALSITLLVFAGVLFGILMNGVGKWLASHLPLSYRTCFLIATTVLLLLIAIGFSYLGTQAVQRADEFWMQLRTSVQQANERLSEYEELQRYLPDASGVKKAVTESQGTLLPGMMKGVQGLAWAFTGALVIFFVGLYAAYEPDLYRRGLVKLFPPQQRERVLGVCDELRDDLGRWIIARLISMAIIGVLTAIGLWILGVPLPITLGMIAALLTFVPNIGPLLAAVPQVLLALNVGTNTALYVIILNIVLQGVESYLVTPLVQRHEVSLPPVLTIAAQLLLGATLGVIGVMMAAPLVVVIMVLVQILYIQDRLNDPNPGELTQS